MAVDTQLRESFSTKFDNENLFCYYLHNFVKHFSGFKWSLQLTTPCLPNLLLILSSASHLGKCQKLLKSKCKAFIICNKFGVTFDA